uniref:Reverse transcriptase domain-containing protein n=1 Tax=Tanacetum cinerariifolium TaxID=118510 RepID=A0A6L2J8E0_TANCI|nr:reverse transcriptase domain-containing protein [Tanacetum cinerariifolium]
MVTKLRNEITNFCQRPDESLFEAWERYKLSIDRCPNHNMLPVTQIDSFYNGLNLRHRDTINAAIDGTFMKRRPEECYDLIENMIAHHNDWDTFAQRTTVGHTRNVYASGAYNKGGNSYQPQGNRNLLSYRSDNYLGPPGFNQNQNRSNQNQNYQNRNQGKNYGNTQGNNQGRNQFFQGASHVQNPPPAYQAPGYQASVQQVSIPQPQVVTTTEFTNYMKENDAILKNMQTNMTSLTNSNLELKNMFGQFMKINTASSLGLGTLPSNTITNPKEDLKAITTRSGIAYKGPTIPTTFSPPKVVKRKNETKRDLIDVYEEELTLRVGNKAVTFNLDQTLRYSASYDVESINRIDVIDVASEEYSQEVLRFSVSGNPTPSTEPIVSTSAPTLTPFGDSDFLPKETDAFLAIEDELISLEINDSYHDSEGDILLLEEFVNDDPSSPPLPIQEREVVEL